MSGQQKRNAAPDLRQLQATMCSLDLAESCWSQVNELPQLPVPDLWLTVSRYLSSLRAILAPSTDEPASAREREARRQFEQTNKLVHSFMLHEGPQLQRDLKDYASKRQNWATEFWLEDMYLSNALPLPVNSNPFFLFPRRQFESSNEMLMFATRLIQFSVDFKYRIDQQTLKQDYGSGHGKGKPLCMETYRNFFHSYRMPHEEMDRLLPQSRRSNHIVIASCNQFYILRLGQDPLEDPYKRDSGSLNTSIIFEQLLRIYRVSRECARRSQLAIQNSIDHQEKYPKIGLFTSENRKTWAKIHKKLIHLKDDEATQQNNSTNCQSLRLIEDCLFVMCLDSLVGNEPHQNQAKPTTTLINNSCNFDTNENLESAASVILTGAGSHLFSANRWFDKFLQIIVGRDGICGINIEHSASEGITVLRFIQEFLEFVNKNPPNPEPQWTYNPNTNLPNQQPTITSTNQSSITSPGYVEPKSPNAILQETDKITRLEWHLDDSLLNDLELAQANFDSLIGNFSLKILHFEHFGRSFIKNQNLSPDAFIQLALQFTFFKLHGYLVSTYESASLRQFRFGRVDNIRANTCEAYDWIQSMIRYFEALAISGDDISEEASSSDLKHECERNFIRAITKQVEILRYTIIGSGPDNHLMALKRLAHIRLSTSQLPSESGVTVGYGAVVPDGYGCSYNPRDERIVFCVSTFNDCPTTSSERFAQTLDQCLLEMQKLCLARGV